MSKPAELSIWSRRGDKFSWTFTFLDAADQPYDVSAWTAWRLYVLNRATRRAVLDVSSGTFITTPSANQLKIEFDEEHDLQSLPAREYRYEIDAVLPSDTLPSTVFQGTWDVLAEGDASPDDEQSGTVVVGTSTAVTVSVDVGSGGVNHTQGTDAALDTGGANEVTAAELRTHLDSTANPHAVTATQIGLGNVDNTADADKPVSTAQQVALDLKADDADLTAHTGDTANPHAVTATQVGLGLVDNTSDADKPVSTAQQAALDLKADDAAVTAALALKADLASPAFTGTPTAPTAAQGTDTTQVATTAFVQAEIAASTTTADARDGWLFN